MENNNFFGVISADYKNTDGKTYSEKRLNVIKKYNAREQAAGQLTPTAAKDILVLWYNVDRGQNLNFDNFLSVICRKENAIIGFFSHKELIEQYGMAQFMKLVYTLAKNNCHYYFMDDKTNAFSVWKVKKNLAALKPFADGVDFNYSSFVDFFWNWQTADKSVNLCKTELGYTHRTFYKYANIYEETPFYAEYLNFYAESFKKIAKRGDLPKKEQFIDDFGKITRTEICQKYSLIHEIDIDRILLAFTDRRRKAL